MRTRTIFKWGAGTLVVIILLATLVPVLVNWIVSGNVGTVAGDDKTWIGFLGTLYGAIIGGLISGFLTFLGVFITINEDKKRKFDDTFPKKLVNGSLINENIKFIIELLEDEKKDNFKVEEANNAVKSAILYTKDLLRMAAELNKDSYNTVKTVIEQLNALDKKLSKRSKPDGKKVPVSVHEQHLKDHIFMLKDKRNEHKTITEKLEKQFFGKSKKKY